MPDYCTNKLSIDGGVDAVNDAVGYFTDNGGEVDFNIICPLPPIMLANRNYRQSTSFEFIELPQEAYLDNPLKPLADVLHEYISQSKELTSSSVTHMTLTNLTLIKLRELLDDTIWADLSKDLAYNLKSGVDYLTLHEPTQAKIHNETVELLSTLYYLLYTAPYCLKEYGAQSWFTWAMYNWGTKNNALTLAEHQVDGIYKFVTAYSPPTVWFDELSEKLRDDGIYVNLTLAYVVNGEGGEIHYTAEGERADIVYNAAQVEDFLTQD